MRTDQAALPSGQRVPSAALVLLAFVLAGAAPQAAATFAQALHGGCYKSEPGICRIHVHPFTIPVNDGAGERVFANDTTGGAGAILLWEFSTANSYFYKPTGNFSPVLPAGDFAVPCGRTYYLNILTRGDTSTTTGSFGNAGVTANIVCPN
jgi:hypothetical protein